MRHVDVISEVPAPTRKKIASELANLEENGREWTQKWTLRVDTPNNSAEKQQIFEDLMAL